MRLREWHGGHVTLLLSADEGQDGGVQLMASVLHADVQTADQPQQLVRPQWRGIVNWMSLSNFVQSGVSLVCRDPQRLRCKLHSLHHWGRQTRGKGTNIHAEPADLVFGHKLEILACVSLASVPLYLIHNFTMELLVGAESRFSKLVGSLSRSDALLMRLPVYERNAVPTASTQGLSEAAWKEGITATGKPISDPEKTTLPCRQHLFLLMVGGTQPAGCFKAIVMRSPTEVSPTLFEELHQLAYFGCHDNPDSKMDGDTMWLENVSRQLEALPKIDAETFTTLDSVWLDSFAQMVNSRKAKKGGTVKVTRSELLRIINEGHETLFSLSVERPSDKLRKKSTRRRTTPPSFVSYSDLACEPSKWPEREALGEMECKEKGLRRFQSGDSLGLSSPLGAGDESSLDAKDMLKWFRADGSAVLDNLSPVKVVSGSSRLSSHDEANLQWPQCKDVQYHDVYYEHNWQSEKQERQFKKFRDTVMLEESHHTLTDNPHIPALRYRRSRCPSQLDFSCGGRKLASITRHPSTGGSAITRHQATGRSTIMAAPSSAAPVRSHCERVSDGKKELLTPAGRMVRSASQSDRRLSAPVFTRKDSIGIFRCNDLQLTKRQRTSDLSFSSHNSSGSVFLSHSPNVSSLPLRRLSQASDIVNIFTPPSSRTGSNQVTPESPVEDGSQQSGTPLKRSQNGAIRRLSSESNSSFASVSNAGEGSRESRSQRHKRKLEETVGSVLGAAGIPASDLIYSSCFTKLYQVTKFFVKQLPNSRNLKAEMKDIAEKQVQQVVDLERRRQDLAVKKKLRTSSIVSSR